MFSQRVYSFLRHTYRSGNKLGLLLEILLDISWSTLPVPLIMVAKHVNSSTTSKLLMLPIAQVFHELKWLI